MNDSYVLSGTETVTGALFLYSYAFLLMNYGHILLSLIQDKELFFKWTNSSENQSTQFPKCLAWGTAVWIPAAKSTQRVWVTKWNPDPARFTWTTVCILAMLERWSWNRLRKKLGQRRKEEEILPYGREELIYKSGSFMEINQINRDEAGLSEVTEVNTIVYHVCECLDPIRF